MIALVRGQQRQIEALRGEVERLRRRLNRNSRNSSMPPSSDDALPGRGKPDKRKRGGGGGASSTGQKAAGFLGWMLPDETVCHRSAGRCGCGADLARAVDVGVEHAYQVHDLPVVAVTVTQHEVWRVRCCCGAEHVGTAPDDVPRHRSGMGVNLKTLVIYLIVYQHVPVARCVRLVGDLTGGNGPSTGFAHGMLSRCAAVLSEVTKLIKTAVTMTPVAGEATGRSAWLLAPSTGQRWSEPHFSSHAQQRSRLKRVGSENLTPSKRRSTHLQAGGVRFRSIKTEARPGAATGRLAARLMPELGFRAEAWFGDFRGEPTRLC